MGAGLGAGARGRSRAVASLLAVACLLSTTCLLATATDAGASRSRATSLRVAWTGGDSMAYQIRPTLEARLRALGVRRTSWFCRSSTGLVRTDFLNWPVKARRLMRATQPQATFFMIGTNDGQPITAGGRANAFGSAAWKRIYRVRVAGVMRAMLSNGVERVYWIGMPVMRDGVFGAKMRLLNSIFRSEAARHGGVTYIDAWKLFSGAGGSFAPGWRAPDGIHFNIAGVNRLVKAVLAEVRADW